MNKQIISKIIFILGLGLCSSLAQATLIFTATLDGDQEVPPVVTSASGTAIGELTGGIGAWVFSYQIDYSGLSSPIAPIGVTGGHLHNAPFGANGGVVHFLDTFPFNFLGTTAGSIIGDWRFDDASNPLTDSLAMQLLAGNIYINLHTENFNGGEIRGQFTFVPEPGALILLVSGLLLVLKRKQHVH